VLDEPTEIGSRHRALVFLSCDGGIFVSIVRIGLSETKKFAEGYDAIFGKKKSGPAKKEKATAQNSTAKKKKKAKKK
jgi:hypothetical protein